MILDRLRGRACEVNIFATPAAAAVAEVFCLDCGRPHRSLEGDECSCSEVERVPVACPDCGVGIGEIEPFGDWFVAVGPGRSAGWNGSHLDESAAVADLRRLHEGECRHVG